MTCLLLSLLGLPCLAEDVTDMPSFGITNYQYNYDTAVEMPNGVETTAVLERGRRPTLSAG